MILWEMRSGNELFVNILAMYFIMQIPLHTMFTI